MNWILIWSAIGNGHQLEPLAAEKLTEMVNDAKKDGVNINVTSSYRTYAKTGGSV